MKRLVFAGLFTAGVVYSLCSPYLYSVVATARALWQPKAGPTTEADWPA